MTATQPTADLALAADVAQGDPLPVSRIGAKEFASTFAANVVIQVCTIAQGILLARVLGPHGRGQFAAAILWPTVFAGVGGLGLSVALARRSAKTASFDRLTRVGLVLSLGTGVVATLGCAGMMPWLLRNLDDATRQAAWCFLPFIILNHVTLALIAIDQGAAKFTRFNWTRLIINPAYLILIVMLWLAGVRDVLWFVASLVAANAVVGLARIIMAAREFPLYGATESPRAVLLEALPFGLAGFFSPLLQQIDKVLLLYLLGETELGLYSVALTASSVAGSLATAAGTMSFGISTQSNRGEGFERVARVFRLSAWIWLFAGLSLAAVIPALLPLIYGRDFANAVVPAILLIVPAAMAGQATILEESMRGQGRAFVGLEARLVGVVAFIAIGWPLSATLRIVGVAIAFGIAQALVLMLMMAAIRWHFPSSHWASFVPRSQELRELAQRARTQIRSRWTA